MEHDLHKDCFAFTRYIAKRFALHPSIVYHITDQRQRLAPEHLGVKLIPLKYRGKLKNFTFGGEWRLILYAIKEAARIDVLIRVHLSYQTALIAFCYKLLNRKGKMILKTDGYGVAAALKRPVSGFVGRTKNRVISGVIASLLKRTDQICIETPDLFRFLSDRYPRYLHKMRFIINGFDEELYQSLAHRELPFDEKEKIILASGRMGSRQKNTELLLEAAATLQYKGWKLVLAGPIEKDECVFQTYIDRYFEKHPHLKEHIVFTGEIRDRATYWEWFNKARVFVHTAVYESYGIVLTEAARFDTYIISTDVGIAREMIERGKGEIIPFENPALLAGILQAIIDGSKEIEHPAGGKRCKPQEISWENEIKKITLTI